MAERRPPMPRQGGRAPAAKPRPVAGTEPAAQQATPQAAPAARPKQGPPKSAPRKPAAQRTPPARTPKVVSLGAVPPEHAPAPRQRPAATPRPTASQRRADDRTMLSGAIRAPHGSEPVAATPKGKAHPDDSKPTPARSFSGHLLVLSLVLAVFAVLLMPTVSNYTRQSGEISDLRASIAEKQIEQQELKDQIARWDDPLYIKQQARDRINLVMPGERNYMVIGSSATSPETEPVNESPDQVRTDLPWVDALWDTVQRAATD